jgi:SAM-dependent methyltransferase
MEQHLFPEMARLEESHWWWLGRRQIVASVLSGMNLPAGAEIFEPGCGTGGNLAMLARFGKVFAMEMDDSARAIANSRGVARVEPGRIPDQLPFGSTSFDAIVLMDVLEHLDDDTAALNALYARLKPGGRLLLTVPAFKFLWSAHDASHHHKRRYVKEELTRLVRVAGFEVVLASYFNFFLFPIIAGVRLIKNKIGGRDDLAVPFQPLNHGLEGLFASERWFLRSVGFPFGVSLIVVAKRPV